MNKILINTYKSSNIIKLQMNNPFNNISSQWNSNADRLIRSFIKIAFKNNLISNIKYKNSDNKVDIQFYIYCVNNKSNKNKSNYNIPNIEYIIILLEKLYNKKVNVIINRIHYPYLNAQIFSEYLGIKSQSNTFHNFKRSIINNNIIKINNLSSFNVGIKIKLHGRIITERVIPRKTQKYIILGSFNNKNGIKNLIIDKGQINLQNDLGIFTITVELAQQIKQK